MNKADAMMGRLKRFPDLQLHSYSFDMNRYFEEQRSECHIPLAVAGLDSKEARRQLALKLPHRVVNMWTDGTSLGAARFGFTDGWRCLFCAYREDPTALLDETGEVAERTGLKPARARELLFSPYYLNLDDATVIAARLNIPDPHIFVGKPLRSVAGLLCATGKLHFPNGRADTDVPLAFSSLLAGVGGFIELVHEVWGYKNDPGHWQYNTLHPLRPDNWEPRGPLPDCYLCSDPLASKIVAEKYRR